MILTSGYCIILVILTDLDIVEAKLYKQKEIMCYVCSDYNNRKRCPSLFDPSKVPVNECWVQGCITLTINGYVSRRCTNKQDITECKKYHEDDQISCRICHSNYCNGQSIVQIESTLTTSTVLMVFALFVNS